MIGRHLQQLGLLLVEQWVYVLVLSQVFMVVLALHFFHILLISSWVSTNVFIHTLLFPLAMSS